MKKLYIIKNELLHYLLNLIMIILLKFKLFKVYLL